MNGIYSPYNHKQESSAHGHVYLVGGIPTPLKNDGVSSSVGMTTFPIVSGKSKKSMVPVTTNQH